MLSRYGKSEETIVKSFIVICVYFATKNLETI